MQAIKMAAAVAAACAFLCACGGGGDDSSGPGSSSQPVTYPKTTPVAGSLDVFATAYTDSANNTVTQHWQQQVTTTNTDGSYSLEQTDPTNATVTVDGITYHVSPRAENFAADGHAIDYTVTHPDASTDHCSYANFTGNRKLPLSVGESWTNDFTIACADGTSTAYTVSETVVSAEQVTVPAGTFSALKEQMTSTWTTPRGEHVVETETHWIDPARSFFTLKSTSTYVRTGTVPSVYVTGQTTELQSRSR